MRSPEVEEAEGILSACGSAAVMQRWQREWVVLTEEAVRCTAELGRAWLRRYNLFGASIAMHVRLVSTANALFFNAVGKHVRQLSAMQQLMWRPLGRSTPTALHSPGLGIALMDTAHGHHAVCCQ